jgi:hypothetical protein
VRGRWILFTELEIFSRKIRAPALSFPSILPAGVSAKIIISQTGGTNQAPFQREFFNRFMRAFGAGHSFTRLKEITHTHGLTFHPYPRFALIESQSHSNLESFSLIRRTRSTRTSVISSRMREAQRGI